MNMVLNFKQLSIMPNLYIINISRQVQREQFQEQVAKYDGIIDWSFKFGPERTNFGQILFDHQSSRKKFMDKFQTGSLGPKAKLYQAPVCFKCINSGGALVLYSKCQIHSKMKNICKTKIQDNQGNTNKQINIPKVDLEAHAKKQSEIPRKEKKDQKGYQKKIKSVQSYQDTPRAQNPKIFKNKEATLANKANKANEFSIFMKNLLDSSEQTEEQKTQDIHKLSENGKFVKLCASILNQYIKEKEGKRKMKENSFELDSSFEISLSEI